MSLRDYINERELDNFYDGPVAEVMSRAYIGQVLEGMAQAHTHNTPQRVTTTIEVSDVTITLDFLKQLRRFYSQKFIPRQRVMDLDELIKRLEQIIPVG
ncbi:MAG: hypothetical protein FWE16_01270 [Firmicutes bacterium]|nr:hypothetical protein [Bacillota bacterium]